MQACCDQNDVNDGDDQKYQYKYKESHHVLQAAW